MDSGIKTILEILEKRKRLRSEQERIENELRSGRISLEQAELALGGLAIARLGIEALIGVGIGG